MTCDFRDTRLAIIRLKSHSITAPRAEIIQNRCSLILRLIAGWSRPARIALRKAYAQQAPRAVLVQSEGLRITGITQASPASCRSRARLSSMSLQ